MTTDEKLDEIKGQLAKLLNFLEVSYAARAMDSFIFTTPEAIRFSKHSSTRALNRWAEQWGVKPDSQGRWSRSQMELAMEREAGWTHTPATLRLKQKLIAEAALARKTISEIRQDKNRSV